MAISDGFCLSKPRHYAGILNVDWFQPFKNDTTLVGVIYLALMNFLRHLRFKRENVLLVGIIPALKSYPASLNAFLKPLVDELKAMWEDGVLLTTSQSPTFRLQHRLALLCISCDIPASRKACGFLGHSAKIGCSKFLKVFPGEFGYRDYSGFNRELWPLRANNNHCTKVAALKYCSTPTARAEEESKIGALYSVLLELPYVDIVRFSIIDPMHNLFLGTAKSFFKNILIGRSILTQASLQLLHERIIRQLFRHIPCKTSTKNNIFIFYFYSRRVEELDHRILTACIARYSTIRRPCMLEKFCSGMPDFDNYTDKEHRHR